MKTYTILINYNNWKDTLCCLWSLIHQPWDQEVIVVDNSSKDNSIEHIKKFINNPEIIINENLLPNWYHNPKNLNLKTQIHLIGAKENNGFAAGNNLGIKRAISLEENNEFYVWLLNNDTLVNSESLPELINYYEAGRSDLVGSQICDYEPPHRKQSFCGVFNPNTAQVKVYKDKIDIHNSLIYYPVGASLFTSKSMIEKVGLMDESYFLYYEELDWCMSFLKAGLKAGISEKSLVYHKQGATTGSKKFKKKTNLHFEKYKYLGLIKFYRKNFSDKQHKAYLNLFLKGLKRFSKGEIQHAILIFKVVFKT